jgi:glycosyltransferase involved in cell wall biosynthesis
MTPRDRHAVPVVSVVIPTFNNLDVLARNLESWRRVAADQPIEIIVVEDGCRDRTAEYLQSVAASEWGARHLRWHHQDDLHELRCTNCGLRDARAPLAMAWQDDMLLRASWLVPEIVATFAAYADLGLLCLSRGLDCFPLEQPIASWEDLIDERRLQSTIGPRPLNWFLLQEVDSVIRPWVVRRACLEAVGFLDEAFVPTEWDEADLSFRIRRAGWKIATHGYERVGAYEHLGSTTIGALSEGYKAGALRNGRLFHERWDDAIRRESGRRRKTWRRRTSARGWWWTASRAVGALASGGRRAASGPD